MRFGQILFRSIRLRCPSCGQGRLYARWYQMHPQCSHCGFPFQRESGFYLGAIYFNYGLTALVVAITYPLFVFTKTLSPNEALAACMAFVVFFPLFFFRYARSLWLGFDEFIDPRGSA